MITEINVKIETRRSDNKEALSYAVTCIVPANELITFFTNNIKQIRFSTDFKESDLE